MTYPGTKPRVPSAIESSLITRVAELERERDELVEALRAIHAIEDKTTGGDWDEIEEARLRAGEVLRSLGKL